MGVSCAIRCLCAGLVVRENVVGNVDVCLHVSDLWTIGCQIGLVEIDCTGAYLIHGWNRGQVCGSLVKCRNQSF